MNPELKTELQIARDVFRASLETVLTLLAILLAVAIVAQAL